MASGGYQKSFTPSNIHLLIGVSTVMSELSAGRGCSLVFLSPMRGESSWFLTARKRVKFSRACASDCRSGNGRPPDPSSGGKDTPRQAPQPEVDMAWGTSSPSHLDDQSVQRRAAVSPDGQELGMARRLHPAHRSSPT